jgi:hypothetical protein
MAQKCPALWDRPLVGKVLHLTNGQLLEALLAAVSLSPCLYSLECAPGSSIRKAALPILGLLIKLKFDRYFKIGN